MSERHAAEAGAAEVEAGAGGVELEPLRCGSCGAAVPLRAGDHVTCPYCRATVPVPGRYRRILAERAREEGVRRELEERFGAAARPPHRWFDVTAVAMVVVLPVVVAVVWMALARHAVDTVTLFSYGVVPAMLPGAGLWLWSAAVHATIVRFNQALAMGPPEREGGPGVCRECGAPLAVTPDAISVHCLYCDTDNLVVDVSAAKKRLDSKLGRELRTLDQAAKALRLRRRLLVAGAAVAVMLFALVLWSLVFAYRHVSDPGLAHG